MSHKRSCVLHVALLLLAAAGVVRAAPAPDPSPELFPQDERLARAVAIRTGRVYLGEMLEDLSRDTGVSLTVDDARGPVSGIQLTAFVTELPLRQVMAGLVALFSHRHDRWEWQTSPRDRRRYVLRHQRSPGEAAAAARAEIFEQWAADVRAYHAIARLPEPQRAARARLRPDLFHPGGVNWQNADLLAELRPAELEAVLQGATVPLDRSRLSPRGAAVYDREIAQAPLGTVRVRDRSGVMVVQPRDNSKLGIEFFVEWKADASGPVLHRRVGSSQPNVGAVSTNVVGGGLWESQWRRRMERGWRDWLTPEVQEFHQRAGKNDPEAGHTIPPSTIPVWIRRAAETQELNILVDPVTSHRGGTYGSPRIGRTPEQTVLALTRGDYTSKRLGELYLLRHESAPANPRRHLVAWPRIKALREAADRNGGYLGFPQLLALSDLTPDQCNGLIEEFPDADAGRIETWRPMLRFYLNLDRDAQARLQTTEGLPFRDAGVAARQALEQGADPLNHRGLEFLAKHLQEATLSLRVEAVESDAREGQRLVWEIRAPGTRGHRGVFVQQPRRPLAQIDDPKGAWEGAGIRRRSLPDPTAR